MTGRAMLYRIEFRLMQWWGAALAAQDVARGAGVPPYYRNVSAVIVLAKATRMFAGFVSRCPSRLILCGTRNSTVWRHGNEQREIQGTTEKS